MAIFNMSDSSINEYLGGEVNTSLNEADRLLKNYRKESDDKKTDILGFGHRKNLSQYSDKDLKDTFKSYSNHASTLKKYRNYDPEYVSNGSFEREEAKNAGKELKKRGYDPKAIREKSKKDEEKKQEIINKINDSKRRQKLKEAAEYILSVLDEMDYIEESYYNDDKNHFLNEGISDFFKDAEIKNKINNNKSLVYKNANLQSYITKIHNEIIKAIKDKKIRNCKYYSSNSKNSNSYIINAYAKDYPIKYNGTAAYTTNINSKVKHELIEYVNDYINNEILDSGDKVKLSLQESTNENNTELEEKDISGDVYFNFTVYIGKNNLRKYVNK